MFELGKREYSLIVYTKQPDVLVLVIHSNGCELLKNLLMYLHSKALNKMFAYNHKQSEWRELAAMKTPRSMFGAVIHNGKIVVAGGVNEEGLTASCEAYDFSTNK